MPEGSDRLFIAIGVSKPKGGLDELPGAITASERMAAWAEAQGYTTLLLHDAIFPEITIDLLRDKIASAIDTITNQTELKRLVIFFSGHGAALAIGDQYWILTNWNKRSTEAIKVSSLQRMLEYYGPLQVSIIGDACQEFSSKFIDLIGSAILDKPDEDQRTYELDQFFAVDVGKQAFMIKATDNNKSFCLFTEVILDALEGGINESYIEVIGGNKVVTSQALARHLDASVALEASKYGVQMKPRPRPGFYTDRTYFTLPNSSAGQEKSGRTARKRALKNSGANNLDINSAQVPRLASTKVNLIKNPLSTALPSVEMLAVDIEDPKTAKLLERDAFVNEVSSAVVRNHFETDCGICVSGTEVTRVDVSYGVVSRVAEDSNWFRVDLLSDSSLAWSSALVTLMDGRIVPVTLVKGFVAALHIFADGSLSLFHRALGGDSYEDSTAIELLAGVHTGLLGQEEIIRAATMLRHEKHKIITLGCIAAQFYDAIRDVESLRSMAAFYAEHQQPVPLDIILYGDGTITESDGRLYADIPAVPERKPRTPDEEASSFTHHATPAFTKHPIAGHVPWMRQAWGAIATAHYDVSGVLWREQALTVMEYLAPGIFTCIRSEGREALCDLTNISAQQSDQSSLLTTT